ncbi:MAG: glycosyltransferase family 4 protein [Chloroflexi bacterium]|nr:glycosyltransferase family 4 protein [Chloroflexota bacterium]
MRIGIYTLVTPGPHTGVGRQLVGLLGGLSLIDQANEYWLYHAAQDEFLAPAAHFRGYPVPVTVASRGRNHLYQAVQLPRLAARHHLDVLHIPNTMPLLFPYRPTIVTLYDLTEFALPQRVYEKGRHGYRRLANWLAARRADTIITTSFSTKRDIVRFLGVDEGKIQVIYPGIDHEQFRPQEVTPERRAYLAQTYHLPDSFLLYVGKIQPRKNLTRLLHAFHQVRQTHPEVHLVLAGSRGWMNEELDATLEQLDLTQVVHSTGFVADEDLPAFYNLAEMLVFPSLYEGFGFPVLEAMACGTPVVTSATSSLAELAAAAAVCVDPLSVEAIAAAILSLLDDRRGREALRQKGLAHAQTFTWTQCAQETLTCYQRVGSRE